MKYKKYILVLALLAITTINLQIKSLITNKKMNVDLIIFSFDRPTQLYALLESIEKYISGLGDIRILYRTSNNAYEIAYQELQDRFTQAIFVKQGDNPKADFKPLTMQCLQKSPNNYIAFAVDDMIIKDFINLAETTRLLEKYNAYGFYLRLGKNITFSYPWNKPNPPSNLAQVEKNICTWPFQGNWSYWGYPNTVDMTVYPKELVLQEFKNMNFTSPNTLEGRWASRLQKSKNKRGLCHNASKVLNIPVNLVQNTHRNRNMNYMTPKTLLDVFNSGLKIDIDPFYQLANNSAHIEYELIFKER